MKYYQLILLFVTFSIAISCNTKNKTKQNITNVKDYNVYFNNTQNTSLEGVKSDIDFWEHKIKSTPNQYPYYAKLASANSTIFKITGDIDELKKAEENLVVANEKTNFNNAGYLRTLARNYISQHRFNEALELALKAEKNGEKLKLSHFILIDIYLELGNLPKVEEYLSKVKNIKSFDYLIRVSKYNDHIGNLDNAIIYLEKSLSIAKSSKNKTLLQWNYTNLADYYGHAGSIKDSYKTYLKALELNPNDSYAKKGIAWIVYSYERNPKEALRILDKVIEENKSPDYHLLKAEIADFMGNDDIKNHQVKKYLSKVNNKKYGVMYHKYDALLYADNSKTTKKAIEIAEKEVKDRPTAQSYNLLAWSLYKDGNKREALKITENHVLNKTFEPEALLHSAFILKANGKIKEATTLKEELLGAIYELGPLSEKEIKSI